jgi:hypothetical protein
MHCGIRPDVRRQCCWTNAVHYAQPATSRAAAAHDTDNNEGNFHNVDADQQRNASNSIE